MGDTFKRITIYLRREEKLGREDRSKGTFVFNLRRMCLIRGLIYLGPISDFYRLLDYC